MKQTNELYIMSESDQRWRNELIKELAKQTRMPVQRVMMMTWTQLERPNRIRTQTGREVELDEMMAVALSRLPRRSKYMFSMTPFPPLIPDEWLDPTREYIEKHKKWPVFIKRKAEAS